MTANSNIVKLNIGGTVFQTTKTTLTRFDGFFKTMLETDVPVARDEFGAIFIDRDPKHFRLILNFMRDGHVAIPKSEEDIQEMKTEAQYYLLTGLLELCKTNNSGSVMNEKCRELETSVQIANAFLDCKKKGVIVIYYPKTDHFKYGKQMAEVAEKYRDEFDVYFTKGWLNQERLEYNVHKKSNGAFYSYNGPYIYNRMLEWFPNED